MESVCDDAERNTLSFSGRNEASASQASAEALIESVNSDPLSDAMNYASDDVLQCQSSDETKDSAQVQSALDSEAVDALGPIVNLESRSVAADEIERKGHIQSTSAAPEQATIDTLSDSIHGISSFRRESASGLVETDEVGHGDGNTEAVVVRAFAFQVAPVEDHAASDDSNKASLKSTPESNSKVEGTTREGDGAQVTVVSVAATAQVALADDHGNSIVSNVASPACANTEAAAAGVADASPLDDTTFFAEARAASKVIPYSPAPSPPVSAGLASASFQRLQSRATIILQLCELLFMVFNTFYATYTLGLVAAQVELGPTQSPEISNLLSSSADGSFYIVTHSKPLVRDIIQPVNSASSSFFPAVQSGSCSAACAHMYSQKLYNSLEQSLDVFSKRLLFVRGAEATSAEPSYEFWQYQLPEPLNAKFISAQCPVTGSSLKSISFLCDAAIVAYPHFIAAITMWCAYFVVLIVHNLVPIVTFKADLNDLRLRVAIESHNNSRQARLVRWSGHLFSLATFGIALAANSEFAKSNDKYLISTFLFAVNNYITLCSIMSSEFSSSMSASEIKERWPRPIKCSVPAPLSTDIWTSLSNVVCHQSDYFAMLLRSLHQENRNDLQTWGDSQEILEFMTEIMSSEGAGDIPSESKQISFPMLCQIFIFVMSLLIGYQSFSFISEAALIYNQRVYHLDQAQHLGVALKRGTVMSDLVSNLTKILPTALPGTSKSAILGSLTATFLGYSTTNCTRITGAPVSVFQMSAGICKPLKDGRSISIDISSQMQGSLNIFPGSSCVGAKSRVVQLNSFVCDEDSVLVGAVPFEERSYPDFQFFEKEFRSLPVQSLYVTFEGPVPFTDANVSVSLGTVEYAGDIVNLGSMRYGSPGFPFSTYPLAGEQRIAACRLSESLCIPSINDLYLKHRPSSQIIEINFMKNTNHGSCAPKPPYHKKGLDFAFYFSEKFASYLTAPSSATVECSSPVAFVPTLNALWALYLAALAFFLFSHALKYSPTDFRFFIALELGTVISLQYRMKHIGVTLAVATAVVSFTSGTADWSIATRASLFIYMFFAELSSLFRLHSSPLLHHRECVPTGLFVGSTSTSGSAGSSGPKHATTSLKEVLQSLTVPIQLKLPASRASFTNLYRTFVSKTDVFNHVERAVLKDVLCNGSSLNTWGDGAAIGEVMKLVVKSSCRIESRTLTD